MNILKELEWRGLLADCTDAAELGQLLAGESQTLYCGFDPTSDSLHVGNLVPLLALRRFQEAGHHPIAVAGGATGLIGDPSGKATERPLLTEEELAHNIQSITKQLSRFLDFSGKNGARLMDNADWTRNVGYLDFLRDVGKHLSVNVMIAKESVRSRMEDKESGISYTEFSYMLLQAFDFMHLCRSANCVLQIGGSDQWGNITAGIDLCRKKLARKAYGLTLPLVTNPDGSKFGKTVSGAVWIDPAKTSIYRFYQFWMRTDDRKVIEYLKFFTFLKEDEIAFLESQHASRPEERAAQQRLAREMTELIHGRTEADEAMRASQILFGGQLDGITEKTFGEILGEVPTHKLDSGTLEHPLSLVEALVLAGLSSSKGQGRKDIEGGGVYINNLRQNDAQKSIEANDFLFGKHLLLRKGKKNYAVLTRRAQ